MLPLPKLFEATEPNFELGGQTFDFNIDLIEDPIVKNILAGTAISGITGFAIASAPTIITTTIVETFVIDYTTSLIASEIVTTTSTVTTIIPAKVGSALAAGATTAGIALVVLALGYIQKARSEKLKQRDLSKQRDAINELNRQIQELDKSARILNQKLNDHVKTNQEVIGQKVLKHNFHVPSKYQVKSGDYLIKIAKEHGVTLNQLLEANPQFSQVRINSPYSEIELPNLGRNPKWIYPGEYINIPPNSQYINSQSEISNFKVRVLEKQLPILQSNSSLPKLNSNPAPKVDDLLSYSTFDSITNTFNQRIFPKSQQDFGEVFKNSLLQFYNLTGTYNDIIDPLNNIIDDLKSALSNITDEEFQALVESIIAYNNLRFSVEGKLLNWVLDDLLVQTQGKVENVGDYFYRSGMQIVKGAFTDDSEITALGSFGEIAIGVVGGLTGLDAPLDIRDIAGHASKDEWGWAIFTGVSLLPVVGLIKVYKPLKKIKASKFWKALDGGNWQTLKKYLGFQKEMSKVLPTSSFNPNSLHKSDILTKNLSDALSSPKPKGFHGHHIIPGGNYSNRSKDIQLKLKELRNKLKEFEIDINDANNGVFLPGTEGLHPTAINHNKIHTNKYFENLHNKLSELNTRERLLEKLAEIREESLNGTIIH